jgi:hypothetical protein
MITEALKRRWVVIFHHPYYPEVNFFDNVAEAYKYAAEIVEENHRDDGHNDGYVFVGEMAGIYTDIKTYY